MLRFGEEDDFLEMDVDVFIWLSGRRMLGTIR